MRIVAGAWRGRTVTAPAGQTTRPTADRVRQALFDMLMHAPWAGRSAIEGSVVLDGFAGTGALGLEALSRGAARAWFVENDAAALAALRSNIASCKAGDRCQLLAGDVLRVEPREPAGLVFLDPPYGHDLVRRALERLAGRLAPDALVIAELARDEAWTPPHAVLAERIYGAARVVVFRVG